MEKFRELYEQIHRAAFLASLNPAQKTLVDVHRFGKLILGISVLDTKVLYVGPAALHVIIHFVISNLKFRGTGWGWRSRILRYVRLPAAWAEKAIKFRRNAKSGGPLFGGRRFL